MANKRQLRILRQGVEGWNEYRKRHRQIKINLRGANLKEQNLSGADFSEADIRSTNFTGADLSGTNFTGARAGLQKHKVVFVMTALFILLGISGAASGLAGVIATNALVLGWFSKGIYNPYTIRVIAVPALLIVFLITTIRKGLTKDIALLAAIVSVTFALLQPLHLLIFGREGLKIGQDTAWQLAGAGFWVLLAVAAGSIAITCSWIIARSKTIFLLGAWIIGLVIALYLSWIVSENSSIVIGFWSVTIAWAVIIGIVCTYVSYKYLAEIKNFVIIREFAIAFAAVGGTSFRGANLTEANFTNTILKSTDFREANLTRVRWYGAKMLHHARSGDTYIKDLQLRKWLIGKGTDRNFDGKDLRGINLQGSNLTYASFIRADLSEANLQDVDLSEAQLIQTQLYRTDLSGAILTGVTIQDWGINLQTKIDNVICDYVYLKKGKQDRIPYDKNRTFKPGEFAKSIEKTLNTIDLLFSGGIDWRAFFASFQTLQDEYGAENIGVQAIERRTDNTLVVRLEGPKESEINHKFFENYQLVKQDIEAIYKAKLEAKDNEVEIYRQQSDALKKIIENLANRPIVINSELKQEEKYRNSHTGEVQS